LESDRKSNGPSIDKNFVSSIGTPTFMPKTAFSVDIDAVKPQSEELLRPLRDNIANSLVSSQVTHRILLKKKLNIIDLFHFMGSGIISQSVRITKAATKSDSIWKK
jgi:hypothetical protein